MKSILFRADGSKEIGMGHIVRCLALADELKNNNPDLEVVFITKYEVGKRIIEEKDYNVILATDDGIIQIKNLADEDTLLITDFLDTDNQYISEIKKTAGLGVISIDNNTKLKRIDADIVINANVFDDGDKKVIGSTRYFLGPKYMILREEFEVAHKEKKKIKNKVETILVMFGGTDPGGYTIKVADALKNIHDGVHINLILGPAFSYSNKLDEVLSETNRKFDLLLSPKNLIEIMKNADIAITAAGIVLYELATLGIPSIVLPQAKHQEDIAKTFEKSRACVNIGIYPSGELIYNSTIRLMEDDPLRRQLSENAQQFVDGKGAERVIKLLKSEVSNEI
jgi:UDP-2,4-diacetamido-2,4,6-trideoxy-beta-L-altropyranose hydrolase